MSGRGNRWQGWLAAGDWAGGAALGYWVWLLWWVS